MSTIDDSQTIAVALSYAIAALEKLPDEWADKNEMAEMKALMERIVPDGNFRAQFMNVARDVLNGFGLPRPRPTLV